MGHLCYIGFRVDISNALIIAWGKVADAKRVGTVGTFPITFTNIPTVVMCETSTAVNGNGYIMEVTISTLTVSSYNYGDVPYASFGY